MNSVLDSAVRLQDEQKKTVEFGPKLTSVFVPKFDLLAVRCLNIEKNDKLFYLITYISNIQ